jgi:predicted HTH transcriptional regulator
LEIIVEASTVPISLRDSYYWRSGSVKQELKGHALTEFLLKKMGMTWDRVVEEKATMDDIDDATIELLKAPTSEKPALESRRDDFGKNSDETSGKRRKNVGYNSGCLSGNPVDYHPEMAEKIGITERSVQRNIQKLQAEGFLRRVGGRKEGYWEVHGNDEV